MQGAQSCAGSNLLKSKTATIGNGWSAGKSLIIRPTIAQPIREFLAISMGADPNRLATGTAIRSDDPVVAHLPDVIVLQAEKVAKDRFVLRADAFTEPADFAGGCGEARHDVGNGDGADAGLLRLDIAAR